MTLTLDVLTEFKPRKDQLTEMRINPENRTRKLTRGFCDEAAKDHATASTARWTSTGFSLSSCPDIARTLISPFASNF